MSRRAPRPLATALARAQEAWPRVTGTEIAAAAHPVAERDGVLTISCDAAVWAHELALMEPALLDSLNAELGAGAVRRLRCRTG